MSEEKILVGDECRGLLKSEVNEHGLTRLSFNTEVGSAELYLQGAHLTKWDPNGLGSVLFLSKDSAFVPGKAIRGGVPLIFPWFGARSATPDSDRTDGPAHGFARTSEWRLTKLMMDRSDLTLELALDPNDLSKSLGYDDFRLLYKLIIGQKLAMELTVENHGSKPLHFEEALHSYFYVWGFDKFSLDGLADTEFFDKTEGFKRKTQTEQKLVITAETDRVYLDTTAPININDPLACRRITVAKENSKNTVIWNPGPNIRPKISDMDPSEWTSMICVETANVGDNLIALAPGAQHTMKAQVSISEV